MKTPVASIIICTKNRAEHLRPTLENLRQLDIPSDIPTEVVLVDNGSTDNTATVAQEASLPFSLRYVHVARPGKAFAYDEGFRQAKGQVLLSTDDDVRLVPDWIQKMSRPILEGQADGVAGAVVLAAHLHRPWMTAWHRMYLASTEAFDANEPPAMTGANMSFARHVLERIPGFDPEIGAGALGFCEDTLFSFQMKHVGYRLVSAFDAVAEHHPDLSRLLRRSLLQSAARNGQSWAYMHHHWNHIPLPGDARQWPYLWARLWASRMKRRGEIAPVEGMPEWEMKKIFEIYYRRHYLLEVRRPHNYEQYGIHKRAGIRLAETVMPETKQSKIAGTV